MGHALHESIRVLKPGGRVVDIRPNFPAHLGKRRHARQQVYCQVAHEAIRVATLAREYVDFHFADRVVSEAVAGRKLTSGARTSFVFRHYFDSLELFDRCRALWWDKAHIPVSDRRLLERVLRRHHSTEIRVDTPVQLQVLTKI